MDSIKNNRNKIASEYRSSSTTLKQLLIIPKLAKIFQKLKGTKLLDIGAGSGEISQLASHYGIDAFAIDQNTDKTIKGNFSFEEMEGSKIKYKDNSFDNVLLVNVLSCIDSEKEIISVLKEAKRCKKESGKIFAINMAEEVNNNSYKDLLKSEAITHTKDKILLTFKLMNGNKITFPDHIIRSDMMKIYCEKSGLSIEKVENLPFEKQPVYRLFILK